MAVRGRGQTPPLRARFLLNVIIGLAGAELGHVGGLVLLLVVAGHGGVQGGAGDQIHLPGDLVGGVSLALGAGAEAHAGDAVAALDGYAVGGEGPLVGEGAAVPQVHGVPLGLGVGVADALVAPEGVVGVHQGLDVGGINLFAPGKNPKGNMLFLTFLVNVLMMVYKNQDLLRASIMSAGNSHRLGANEAPPAILSIFLGKQLSATLDEIVRQVGSSKMTPEEKTTLKLGIGRIPEILLDTTDRNRTSPFAFTGNRFEFRAAGSSSNCAAAMIAINAAMANQLNEFRASVEKLMEEGIGKDEAIFRLLKETIIASEPIRFEGDGYSEEWKQEAARRGLSNICHVPEALMHYMDNQSKSVLIGERIFNETELACRLEVELEKYTMKVQIESRVLGDLAINHIVPIAVIYQNRLLENLRGLKEIFPPEEYEIMSADRKELIREISRRVTAIKVLVRDMTEARKVANHKDNFQEKAFAYEETVRPYLDNIRDHIDHLEMEIDDEIWPLPKYRELLFTK